MQIENGLKDLDLVWHSAMKGNGKLNAIQRTAFKILYRIMS